MRGAAFAGRSVKATLLEVEEEVKEKKKKKLFFKHYERKYVFRNSKCFSTCLC
jgi:hypothetical protein